MIKITAFLLLVISLILPSALAEDFLYNWQVGPSYPKDIEAYVGDTVTFEYSISHDVHIHPSGDCSKVGTILVGDTTDGSVTYTFSASEAGTTVTFACDQGSHCILGQIISFAVEIGTRPPTPAPVAPTPSPTTKQPTPSPTTAPPTKRPTPSPTLAPVTASPTKSPTTAPVTSAPTSSTPAPITSAPTRAPFTAAPTKTPTTTAPTNAPVTGFPTFIPTVSPTTSPSSVPSKLPSMAPVTSDPTEAPVTNAPTIRATGTTEVATDLSQTLLGMTDCDNACQAAWSSTMEETTANFYSVARGGVTVLSNSVTIVGTDVSSRRRLEDGAGLLISYDHTFEYTTTDNSDPGIYSLAGQPLAGAGARNTFVADLKATGLPVFDDLTGVTAIDIPSPTAAPTAVDDEPVLSQGAIIGIAAGGAVILLAIIGCLCCRKKDDSQQGGPPPDVLKVPPGRDEVSTLGGPDRPYGDQSVATVDYDYSKAYGGGGDTSVSEAGGTYGSNTQGLLDPANAVATGGALGGFDGGGSFEDAYRGAGGNVKEELIHIFAPPGKLGVVIDTPDDGAPVVHAVKDSSVIADKIQVGDKLVAVDDEDVRAMTAIKVSKLISRKSANPSRKLSVIRTTVIE